jgi:hypothetical protein
MEHTCLGGGRRTTLMVFSDGDSKPGLGSASLDLSGILKARCTDSGRTEQTFLQQLYQETLPRTPEAYLGSEVSHHGCWTVVCGVAETIEDIARIVRTSYSASDELCLNLPHHTMHPHIMRVELHIRQKRQFRIKWSDTILLVVFASPCNSKCCHNNSLMYSLCLKLGTYLN